MTHLVAGERTPALDAVFQPVSPPTTFEETVERLGTAIRLGEEARAVLDYRLTVETGAAVLAAERATAGDLDRIEGLTEEMSASEGARFEEYRRADVRFHIGLAEAAHSPRLVAAMTEVQGQMSDLIQRIAHPDEVLASSNAQHVRLVAHLRERETGS